MNSGETLKQQVEELWQKHLPLMLSRLDVLARAIDGLSRGVIHGDLKMQAAAEAHKLAGSLGTFGLEAASDSALCIERLLATHSTPTNEAAGLAEHLRIVRESIHSR